MALVALVAGLSGAAMLRNEVSLLTTRGSSMFPHFRTGDLAVTVLADRYRVGDIAAYRAQANGSIVLHRIVANDDGRLTFKGDNNTWLDPDHPRPDELVGRLWFRIPKAGMIADYTSAPGRTVLLIGGVLLLLAGGSARSYRRRSRRRSDASGRTRDAQSTRPGRRTDLAGGTALETAAALAGPAITLAATVLLVGLAASTPATRLTSDKRTYDQRLTYGYSGTAITGTTYPDGTFGTGDPIFLRLVDRIRVTIGYEIGAEEDTLHNVAGTYAVDAELSGVGSWKHTLELQPTTRFTGTGFSTEVTIDVPAIQALIEATQAETGVKGDNVKIDVVPRVRTNGFAGEIPVEARFDTPFELKLTPLDLTPVKETTTTDDLTESAEGKYTARVERPRNLTFVGRSVTVARARVMTWVALVAAMAWLGVAVGAQRALMRRSAGERLARRYHDSIVDVGSLPATGAAVKVGDVAALVRLAERSDHLILHHHDGAGRHTFVLEAASATYRCVVDDTPAVAGPGMAPAPELGPEPEAVPDLESEAVPELEPEAVPELEPEPEALHELESEPVRAADGERSDVDWSNDVVPPPFVGIPPPYVPEPVAVPPPHLPEPVAVPPPPPAPTPEVAEIRVQTLDEALRLTSLTDDELRDLDSRTDIEPS